MGPGEALSLDPIHAKLASDLGWCLFRADRIAEALVELERAVEMDPADELVRGNLTLVRKEIARGSRGLKKPRADTLA
jgi:Flp pilus assembly protein TadD